MTRTVLAGRRPRLLLGAALAAVVGTVGALLVGAGHPRVEVTVLSLPPPLAPEVAAGPAVLRPVDGGPDYYGRFTDGLPTDPSFFPVAVWYESVLDVDQARADAAAGINTYVELTGDSDLDAVREAGMHAIVSGPGAGPTAGWLLADEADMWAGAGEDAWTGAYPGQGDVCAPAEGACGYTVQQAQLDALPADGRLRYANYGKGVTFYLSDADAGRFVNQFQDVVSADNYWFTDGYICGEGEGAALLGTADLDADRRIPDALCHRAANYGLTIDRLRSLVQPAGSRPVWAFVEVGHPFDDDGPSITPAQIRAAVWSSLVHEARGVVYFNHSFGGPCPTQHALREPCYSDARDVVTDLDRQIAELAPVLNAPTVDGVTTVAGRVDVLTKYSDGDLYLLAASTGGFREAATVRVGCAGSATVTVVGEDRTVPMVDGVLSDQFSGAGAAHVYRVPDAAGCTF